MTTRLLLLAGAALVLTGAPAGAETLRDALIKAYKDNPTITAQRAAQRATDENVPIARAAGLPSISLTGNYTENLFAADGNNVLNGNNSFANPARQLTSSGTVSVPIYNGGGVRNAITAAKTRVDAGRATLRGTESDLFTAVVQSYMDVIRDEAIVGLNQQNVRVLEVNLQASRDRFQVGDLTRTDVAQSEARLAVARGQLQSAEASLITSRETYIRVIGTPPVTLEEPPAIPGLPATPQIAVTTALRDSPQLLASQRLRDATRYDIDVAKAGRLPQISIGGGGNYYNYLGALGAGSGIRVGQSGTSGTLGVGVTVPLFQGGRVGAQVRQAEALRSQAIENATATERAVIAQTRSAYAAWTSAQQVIQSSEVAVNANKLSLEGVRAENGVGNRTILDILNAEQELLNSQVTLVTARRDAYVAGFALLAAMGNAEARDLGLDGGPLYDPVANYNRVHHKISDFSSDGEPAAVATSTAASPAQNATVTKPSDPLLDTPVDRSPALTTGADAPSRR
ncbi:MULTISPECIES: TolC family outer membrane protein [unclassified Sphingomonas]|jgi:outer membrane protein|uniref:TolC family outer membrane protein n=1 Tax=unclassified Sphingomonas TaxID=196159 RepID=UPI00226A41D6|nr:MULTISPECIES: TolC family outer membrane protein [unclassified Sphingomonas]